MRFGAHYLPTYVPALDGSIGEFYRHMFEQFEILDELGFSDVWVTEHHFHEYGGTISTPPVFLAAAARTTRRIHLGIAVSVLPLHNPLQNAEAYAAVDVISNGRLEVGVGRGSTMAEFQAFGVSHDDSAQRMRESTDIMRMAWSGEAVTYHGQIFNWDNVRVLPVPVQRPHPPIWVGASRSDNTFQWAGEQGYNVMTLPYMYEPAALRHQLDIYRSALDQAGHDPATRYILGKFHIFVADSDRVAKEQASTYLDNYRALANERNSRAIGGASHDFDTDLAAGNIIAGDPRRCIETIQRWREQLGLNTISGTFHFGGMPQELALTNIRRFAEQVIPAFEGAAVL